MLIDPKDYARKLVERGYKCKDLFRIVEELDAFQTPVMWNRDMIQEFLNIAEVEG